MMLKYDTIIQDQFDKEVIEKVDYFKVDDTSSCGHNSTKS